MVTRVMNLLGVYLGEREKLILETEYNPKGCWEHRALLQVSEEILLRFGGHTHEPPDFGDGWESDSRISDLETRARKIIRKDFSRFEIWGWKDTRLCLTLPFWQRILPDLEYVICVRNPMDVAKSLTKIHPESVMSKSAELWLRYSASAIRNTEKKRRILVSYDNFFKDWKGEVRRLAGFLGSDFVEKLLDAEPKIENHIDRELRHYETGALETFDNMSLSSSIKGLYLDLQRLARDEEGLFLSPKGS